ncbi:hypothetical protein [Rhodococcus sp. X156]|uniref:hypothetical protein n=1 Tax=Rhodococcus sp. X156 TaxID=2499145 RepID=UPI001F4A01BB|nr:hypothetical protein [Rhodococcus sp. X156]
MSERAPYGATAVSGPGRALRVPDPTERDDLASFVGRAVRLDSSSLVRLRSRDDGTVGVWASTGFDAIVARSVTGTVAPRDTTVKARELLTALAVLRSDAVDPGSALDAEWPGALPPATGFRHVDDVPAHVIDQLVERGVELARDNPGPRGGPPASLLDQEVLTVRGEHDEVGVPLRVVFALSGMGFVDNGAGDDPVRVRVTDGWLRLDARYGSVLRRRHPQIPLLLG